jgi:16S rRNA (guanine527-N7)-methyltransferase
LFFFIRGTCGAFRGFCFAGLFRGRFKLQSKPVEQVLCVKRIFVSVYNNFMEDILSRGLKELKLFDSVIKEKCEKYIDELLLFNDIYGLVSVNNRDEIILKHILDSLAPWKLFAEETRPLRIADVGSGAGFPGIPLAIAMPENKFVLIEKKRRRAVFLENVKAALKLKNISVMECEVEKAAKNGERFDIVTCRAFAEISAEMLNVFFSMTAGGKIIFYKGKREKIDAELAASARAHNGNYKIINLSVPYLDAERNAVVIFN